MPIDRKAQVAASEKEVQDLLAQEPGATTTALDKTNSLIQATRADANSDTSGVALDAASTYGLPGNNAAAVAPAVQRGNEDLERTNQDALAGQKVTDRRAHMNRNFNFMFGRMLTATDDRKLAAQTAYEFALDQDKQMYQSQASEKARQNASEKNDIVNFYTQQKISAQRKAQDEARHQALVNSMMRTFFGIAGSVGTAYALKKTPTDNSPTDDYGGGESNI